MEVTRTPPLAVNCTIDRVCKCIGSRMSRLSLLLTISAVGFSSVESFLLSPRRSTAAWLDYRLWNTVIPSGRQGSLRRDELALGAAVSQKTDDPSHRPNQSVRRKTKRPRKHVPVESGESPSAGGGVSEGLADPFVTFVSPMEYAKFDSSAAGRVADASPSQPPPSSLDLAPLPEPSFNDRQRFGRIMDEVLEQEKEEELPAILTKHIDFLLSVDVTSLTNDLIRQEPTIDRVNTIRNAYEFIVSFLESMVESTVDVQKENQTLLRLIIEAAKTSPEVFETRMKKLQDRFTFEFVKYLDAEVERLEKVEKELAERKQKTATTIADKQEPPLSMAIGGNEVLNVIRIVRTRVCAQVDLMMGEDVAVLTRMLSYNDRFMMRAALRTVMRDKTPKEITAFGVLVSSTLRDVVALGSDVDPVLRSKLADMADDIAAVGREVEERQKDQAEREAEEQA